jgi:diphthamide biosynthesis protein 2
MSAVTYGDEAARMRAHQDEQQQSLAACAAALGPASDDDGAFALADAFDVERTADQVVQIASDTRAAPRASDVFRIALQFPDELLRHSSALVALLRAAIGARDAALSFDLFILGDTSYGSCCVDELAASHGCAAMVIHYGRSCLSRTTRLPVLLVFGKRRLDEAALLSALTQLCPPSSAARPVLFFDTLYAHAFEGAALRQRLMAALPQLVISDLDDQRRAPSAADESVRSVGGRQFRWPSGDLVECTEPADATKTWRSRLPDSFVPVWLGPADSPTAKTIQVALQRHVVRVLQWRSGAFVPATLQFQLSRFLMRRHAMVERCRAARAVALLCGTLAAARYAELLVYLRQMARRETKCYTLVVGKPNEAKLANLGAVEAYCLVACRESTLLACETRDFGAPIVTPLELQLAYEQSAACAWDADYSTDFEEVLRRKALLAAATHAPPPDEAAGVHFSLATGRIVARHGAGRIAAPSADADQMHLTQSSGGGELVQAFASSVAVQHLQKSTFRGLDPRLGEDAPSAVVDGRSGIASAYVNEK